jgi:hypothetical protein
MVNRSVGMDLVVVPLETFLKLGMVKVVLLLVKTPRLAMVMVVLLMNVKTNASSLVRRSSMEVLYIKVENRTIPGKVENAPDGLKCF